MSLRRKCAFLTALALGALLVHTSLVRTARAQPQDALLEAERAYENFELQEALKLATAALQAGNNSRARLLQIYRLQGVAAAALGQSDAARESYKKLLALNPEQQEDQNLSPRLRAPFTAAQAYWARQERPLTTDVTVLKTGALRIQTTDPLAMGAKIEVHMRQPPEKAYRIEERAMAEHVVVPTTEYDSQRAIEYYLRVTDAYGNVMVEHGNEFDPKVHAPAEQPATPALAAEEDEGTLLSSPWFWIGVGAAVALGAGIGIAASQSSGNYEGTALVAF